MKAIRRFSVRPVLPAPIAALGDLSMNLRWSWHPPLCDLFESIDPARWEAVGRDPIAMLSAISPDELDRLAADEQFVESVRDAKEALDRYVGTLLLVTHDRALLERVTVTRRLEVADGRVTEVAPR